ncbi:FliH/SctL family protein [Aliikangiella sp. G2MR2-5]|uniref:FliH/SctL family protein n=1 Tax=Aliikangiella sp. G2MR2-5 TaxID=2788943 RepID=UPI0018AAB6D9|nr:FliH/SctL family protein [Aliikangiella sp. G2MR2-5]
MVTKAKSENPIRPMKNVANYSSWNIPSLQAGDAPSFFQPVDEEEEEIIDEEELARQLEEERKAVIEEARKEGFQLGREEGLRAAQEEVALQLDLMAVIGAQLNEPLKVCKEQSEQALLKLAFAVAKQIVRRELTQDPTQLIAIIREALKLLPVGAKGIEILLHPEDEKVVSGVMAKAGEGEKSYWTIKSDPSIERGNCRVNTDNSTVDASIDKQIAVLFSRLVGGQRAGEIDAD